MDRRDFLSSMIASIGVIGCSSPEVLKPYTNSELSSRGKVLLILANKGKPGSTLRIFDWDNFTTKDYFIPLKVPHSLKHSKFDGNIVFIFEMFGDALKLNLATGETTPFPKVDESKVFLGHAAPSADGKLLFATERMDHSSVTVRDFSTMRILSVLPQEIGRCHQVVSLPDSHLLVAGNIIRKDKREFGAITFYDYKKEKIVRSLHTDFPCAHLLPLSSTEVIGVTANGLNRISKPLKIDQVSITDYLKNFTEDTKTPLYYATTKGDLEQLKGDEFVHGFGAAKLSPDKFIVGHTKSDCLVIWENKKISRIVEVPQPLNIVLSKDKTQMIVMSSGTLRSYSLANFEHLKTFDFGADILTMNSY